MLDERRQRQIAHSGIMLVATVVFGLVICVLGAANAAVRHFLA